MSPIPTTQATMTAEWQAWIAENLLRGVSPVVIANSLTDAGFPPQVAQQAINGASRHPYLQAAARMLKDARDAAPTRSGGNRAAKYAWWLEVMRVSAREAADWGTIPRLKQPTTDVFRAGDGHLRELRLGDRPLLRVHDV